MAEPLPVNREHLHGPRRRLEATNNQESGTFLDYARNQAYSRLEANPHLL